uniref:BOS complex subunit NCLN n=1 Tax=Romanomermis culicivorax TaxID=13658 RepID=A0A915K567_ROMCU
MIDDFCDLFRLQFSLIYVLIAVPIVSTALNPASSQKQHQTGVVVQEFRAYRLQHFDLAGNLKGSRNWRVSFDATALNSSVLRRCLIVSWRHLLGVVKLHEILPPTLGAVLILIPGDLTSLSIEDRDAFVELEHNLLEKPFNFGVFLSPETPALKEILENVEKQQKNEKASALATLISMVTANSYHFVSEIQSSNVQLTQPIFNIMSKLSSFERNDKVPTILIVAHYDSFGLAPALSFGADSNASGMIALLEILLVFSKLYGNNYTRARYNLVFLLSGAGKFNFMGSRQFIDDYTEQLENSNSPASKIEFALCLDSLLYNEDDNLYMHVSKLPRNNSNLHNFYTRLQNSASKYNSKAEIVAKKINLGDEYLAWEHERYSIRKIYGFTVSKHANHKNPFRRSILDLNTGKPDQIRNLKRNIRVITEALIDHVFQIPSDDETLARTSSTSDLSLQVDDNMISSIFSLITSFPRSVQNMTSSKDDIPPKQFLLNDLFSIMNHYGHETHYVPIKLDKRDPEFVLYGATIDKIFAYRIKPAIFDLVLASVIIGYLSLLYIFILNASNLQYKLKIYTTPVMSNGMVKKRN